MCILHHSNHANPVHVWSRREKIPKKHIPLNEALMKPDPNFVDERKAEKSPKKHWLERFFGE
ncbi:hypothetical protein JWV37_01715 [Sulfurospirillum sp. T05]|uniref:Uncharacterized protein n=1 Tax=Sulfurospirillum tamanense TaxID=2813362 RepID=A0ABS2WPD1_9BACT|nr:hypothetical protein [Sulfurospirillum tamanensis]MBN2963487.1 hypothetical protein [Sulfurospirillum tamanensis]